MSKLSIYITVPDYLDQWLRSEYWDTETKRVVFPRGSAPRAILQSCLAKAPADRMPHFPSNREIPIEVPTFKGINPHVYCHLPERGKKALVSCLKKYFAALVWQELHPLLSHDVQITDVVYAFLDRHGIEPTPQNWETVRQMYYRLRKKSAGNNVNVC